MFDFGASHNEGPSSKTTRYEIFLGCRGILSEMNKCLTLVHLTSAFRIHSLGSEESKGRDWALNQSNYCAVWVFVADWFNSCCNCMSWRNWSTLDEFEVTLFRAPVGAAG